MPFLKVHKKLDTNDVLYYTKLVVSKNSSLPDAVIKIDQNGFTDSFMFTFFSGKMMQFDKHSLQKD